MAVPFSYSFRNLWKRRLTTILTVTGMALVVFVFAAVLMMAAGLQKTLVETGSPENVVVVRKASTSEVMSSIERKSAAIVEMLPQVATGSRGQPMMAKESVVLIALKKRVKSSPPAIPTWWCAASARNPCRCGRRSGWWRAACSRWARRK